MLTGPLPPASTLGTWIESIELTNVDDDTYVDLSAATEITVSLLPMAFGLDVSDELTLKMSEGAVTLPSLGVIQWRAERSQMGSLMNSTYNVRLIIEINGDVFVLMLGTVSLQG